MRVLVSSGEPSGSVIGALLARKLRALERGVAVSRLQDEVPVESTFGFVRGLAAAARMTRALGAATDASAALRPDVVVLVSYSGWHLPLGRRLRRLGLPVVYVGPPQFWAWGGWRVRQLRSAADRVVCLFDFERSALSRAGIDAVYEGYPLLDAVLNSGSAPARPGQSRYGLLLPGSRPQERRLHEPLFAEFRSRMGQCHPELDWVTVGPDDERRYTVMAGAECALAASGTVTAELAILGVPMVVSYCLPPAELALARLLVRIRHFALPNILASRRVVPEFLNPDADALIAEATALLGDAGRRERMRSDLAMVARSLGPGGAMQRIARLVLDLGSRTTGI